MAKQQLIDAMSSLWKTKHKLIVSELSHEDGSANATLATAQAKLATLQAGATA